MSSQSSSKRILSIAKSLATKRLLIEILIGVVLVALSPYILQSLVRRRAPHQLASTETSLGIKKVVSDVKSELQLLEQERIQKKEEALFRVKSFDLEISFMVRTNEKEGGRVEYQVVTADSEIEEGIERVQKLTLHMETMDDVRVPAKRTAFPSDQELGTVRKVDEEPSKKEK